MSKRIGVVGLGIMGGAISANFLDAGYPVTGYDVDPARNAELAARGGDVAASPGAVALASDIVLTSLPSSAVLDDVVSGRSGIAAAGASATIVMECSTLPIDDKVRNRDALAQAGLTMLDTPLSGTGAQALNRDLSVYFSGDEAAARECQEIVPGFARSGFYVGEFGNGSRMKYVANHLVAIHNVAAAEAMVLGMKAGLDPELIYDVIKDGAGNSRMFEVRGPMMVDDDYTAATMKVAVWQKDMRIIAAFATALGSPTPLFHASAGIYTAAMAQGLEAQDTAAVCRVLEGLAALNR